MISKETFVKTMKSMEKYSGECDILSDALCAFSTETDSNFFMNFTLVNAIIEILQEQFNDADSDWISYFMYDCDYLKNDFCRSIEVDGKPLESLIYTWEDVYDFLIKNMEELNDN